MMRIIKSMFLLFSFLATSWNSVAANYVLTASALSYCPGGGVSISITGDIPPSTYLCTLFKEGIAQESIQSTGTKYIQFLGTYTAGVYSTNIETNTLSITENPVYSFLENHSICSGETYNWQGTNYTIAGDYTAKYTSINGCDSTYNLHITVTPFPKNINSTNGLVAYYPFNNNANDASGHGNNGTLYGPTAVADRDSNENGAYQFNGSSNYILIGNPVPASLQIQNEITLSAWIYATQYQNSGLGMIVGSQCDNCSASGVSIFLDGRSNFDGLSLLPGHIHFQIGNGSWHASNSTTQVPLNQWVHIVATRRANETARIYYNGVSQPLTTVSWNGSISYNGNYFAIGRQKDYTNRFFNGKIDEVRVYNRALSEIEVKALYQDMVVTVSSDTICSNSATAIYLNHPESGMSYQLLKDNVETGTPQTGVGTALVFNTENLNSISQFSLKATHSTTGCATLLDSVITITVNPAPTVTLDPLNNYINIHASVVSLTGSPTGGTFSGSGISGSTFNPGSAGLGRKTISYNYTNTSGCSSMATQTTIVYDTTGVACSRYDTTYISVTDTLYINTIITGLTAPDNANRIKVFPNPAKDHITVDYGNYEKMNGYSLKITNSLGQEVYTTTISQQSSFISINGWARDGIYFVQIIDQADQVINIKKIIIQ